jgi:maltooligosyltrehalose trehalohydrolase
VLFRSFDGLRLDAVHAIQDPGFIDELGASLRARIDPRRHVHLMLENERNEARHLEGLFDAQWNDDGHNTLHVLLTGESEGYYANYVERPADKLARCLAEGWVYQGEPAPADSGRPRGTASAHLAPGRFILFLQNHDQIGNRALGERLTTLADPAALKAAVSLQLLCPQTPLLFMGEEWGCRTPFLYFTDFHDELARAVCQGRRQEFAGFGSFSDEHRLAQIPDPNRLETFTRSIPDIAEAASGAHAETHAFYRRLLGLRRRHLCHRLKGTRARRSKVLSPHAVLANWQLGDGSRLRILVNLGVREVPVPRTSAAALFESVEGCAEAIGRGSLPGHCTCVFLSSPGDLP